MTKINIKDTRFLRSVLTGTVVVALFSLGVKADPLGISEASVFAGTDITMGANSSVWGDIQAGTAVTLGASAEVDGAIKYGTNITYGADAISLGHAEAIAYDYQGIIDAQSALDAMTTTAVLVSGDIATDVTFGAGVYDVPGLLTVTAGKTITLDAAGQENSSFIFNISGYLTFGSDVNVVVINGNENTRVIWNSTGNYISIGANANIIGTILAHSYVSTGANSTVSGVGTSCGVVQAATSYVSIGAGATIGDAMCTNEPPPPVGAFCGDGIVNQSNELCDFGAENGIAGGRCRADCTLEAGITLSAKIHQHCDSRSLNVIFTEDTTNLNWPAHLNKPSYATVEPGTGLIIYSGLNFTGHSLTLTSSTNFCSVSYPENGGRVNDKVLSLQLFLLP